MSAFIEKLTSSWARNQSLVCVGLDPEIERFPRHIAAQPSPIFQFNKAIVDATADLVCAYKPQFAHYAAYEAEDQLERTIEYIHRSYPGIPVILDSKRGDVGNTAERYAIEAFERYGADAVTVNPIWVATRSSLSSSTRTGVSSFCAGPPIPGRRICRTSRLAAGSSIRSSQSTQPAGGTRGVTACSSWVLPIRASWRKFARS